MHRYIGTSASIFVRELIVGSGLGSCWHEVSARSGELRSTLLHLRRRVIAIVLTDGAVSIDWSKVLSSIHLVHRIVQIVGARAISATVTTLIATSTTVEARASLWLAYIRLIGV